MANKKLSKTYFGIPKTPIDEHTIFYASFDGTSIAEIGGSPRQSFNNSYVPTPTGLGIKNTTGYYDKYVLPNNSDVFTIDFIIIPSGSALVKAESVKNVISLLDEKGSMIYSLGRSNSTDGWAGGIITGITNYFNVFHANTFKDNKPKHIRFIIDGINQTMKFFENGIEYKVYGSQSSDLSPAIANADYTKLIKEIWIGNTDGVTISDLHISSIDRGDYFPNLPQDFIEGKATIVPAFNSQRQTYADPLTSEYKTEIVKADRENSKQITVTQATQGVWSSGDKIKVKGLTEEIISGVIDTDTALAKVTKVLNDKGTKIPMIVTDTSKLKLNDTVMFAKDDFSRSSTVTGTITNINTSTNEIEVTYSSSVTFAFDGGYLFETTALSSSPVVKFLNETTLTNVAGTWSGLGTAEATFTLGTNASLTNQDIQVDYSLNEVAGQGQTEVYSEVLGGEVNGEKLVVNPSIHLTDDFKGKISGSTVENPHLQKNKISTILEPPANFSGELDNKWYSQITSLDSTYLGITAPTSGGMPQQLFSFNIIELVERKYGRIKALDKVQWLKDNLANITCSWWGYGTCPAGNKAYLYNYKVSQSAWVGVVGVGKSAPTLLQHTSTDVDVRIDGDGFVHYLVYTDPSNEVTSSTIYTDYINIEVTLITPTGYDVLSSENPSSRKNWRVKNEDLVEANDFKEKVKGSTVENPHKMFYHQGTLMTGLSGLEIPSYNNVSFLDGSNYPISTSTQGNTAQQRFSFNMVELIERKYGKIPSTNKLKWLIDNVAKVNFNWWGYGTCPTGNKAIIDFYAYSTINKWVHVNANTPEAISHTNASPSKLVIEFLPTNTTATLSKVMDSDGYVHYIAYTHASNGTTSSAIYTDYVNCEVTLKESAIRELEYFKDKIGKDNVLLVRKETREVQTMFEASNEDRIVVYGNYIPYQGMSSTVTPLLSISDRLFVTTMGTGGDGGISRLSGALLPNNFLNLANKISDNINHYELTCDTIFPNEHPSKPSLIYSPINMIPLGDHNSRLTGSETGILNYADGDVLPKSLPHLTALYGLVNRENELHLRVIYKLSNDDKTKLWIDCTARDFKIPNRPLIK